MTGLERQNIMKDALEFRGRKRLQMKRTYQQERKEKIARILKRMSTSGGRKVVSRRRRKKRKRLSA